MKLKKIANETLYPNNISAYIKFDKVTLRNNDVYLTSALTESYNLDYKTKLYTNIHNNITLEIK